MGLRYGLKKFVKTSVGLIDVMEHAGGQDKGCNIFWLQIELAVKHSSSFQPAKGTFNDHPASAQMQVKSQLVWVRHIPSIRLHEAGL